MNFRGSFVAFLPIAVGPGPNAEEIQRQERACLERHPQTAPSYRAFLAALLRDREAVLLHLAAARGAHDMGFLYAGIDPTFEWLADDAEFRRIVDAGGVSGWRGRRGNVAS